MSLRLSICTGSRSKDIGVCATSSGVGHCYYFFCVEKGEGGGKEK